MRRGDVTSLDWRDSRHWSNRAALCVHCGRQTNLLDDDRRPSHKMCAEAAIDDARRMPEPVAHGNPFKAAALAWAARGWHVIPLVPGGKEPVLKGWQYRASTDLELIARYWDRAPYNIGIATEPSGLVVVDLDMPKHVGDKPRKEPWASLNVRHGADVLAVLAKNAEQPFPGGTFAVTTRSGGTHLYFQAPDGPTLSSTVERLGWKVDTRARRGYVIAAGSVVDNRTYTVACDMPVAPLPLWLLGALRPTPAPAAYHAVPETSVRVASAYAAAALRNESRAVATAPEGTRNAALVRAGRALGRLVVSGDLPRVVVEDALKQAAFAAGLPERESVPALRSALDWSIRNNRKGAA
ncbi:bifunctional DNA primase/polymerase [Yinghuangia sp. ASG 101]|uniref:bifunctional DNA primase/polymerase n=1 Tax=Yinghuangia sp. ASG 101 TaxID=2896848 RepID=UPI001E6588FB|nr:bifunctional DNA primase/polymerase [Yinghuangia sp. ASG 101]UGQ10037.1 bifunctional DNA primase/polymerase [Yinghuangia sp. ASG 101]